MLTSSTARIAVASFLVAVGIFGPTSEASSSVEVESYQVVVEDDNRQDDLSVFDPEWGRRRLQSLPPGIGVSSCPPGQELLTLDWTDIDVKTEVNNQVFTFSNGVSFQMNIIETAPGFADTWGKDANGNLKFTAGTRLDSTDIIPNGGGNPDYPAGYATMQFVFDRELDGLYISISDVDSGSTSDAVRIRFSDASNNPVPATMAKTGTIATKDDFGYEQFRRVSAKNPGWGASLFAQATSPTQTINLDQSIFSFSSNHIGKQKQRTIYPALEFTYCAPPLQPTSAPTGAPSQDPTASPIQVPAATDAPVAAITPGNGGVNGDPLIMGLKGQLFKFDGRSGAWYSAISSPSFQWNMRITQFGGCPEHSDRFVSGAAFTFFDRANKNKAPRTLEINVVDEFNVDVGCGSAGKHCLGAGSLELIIDGVHTTVGGNYHFGDGSGRVLAFNTFHQCSRKWYDFDVAAQQEEKAVEQVSLRQSRGRRLADRGSNTPGVFDVIQDLRGTMIDKVECDKWVKDRMMLGDLFAQPGHYSTVIVQTEDISFHIEYKQESERCDAHSLDVWISSVSPSLMEEDWEGVIGETKTAPIQQQDIYSRAEMLKYPDDASYEVASALSTN